MAKPTVAATLLSAQALLGDVSKDTYTDAVLLPFVKRAYRKVVRFMATVDNPFVRSEAYYDLPANSRVLDPAAAGMTDVGEILFIDEREVDSSVAVSGVALASSVATVTTATHGRSVGQTVVLFNVLGIPGINGMWTLSAIPLTTEVTLGGSYLSGTYTSGGTMSYSDNEFTSMDKVDLLERVPSVNTSASALKQWAWQGDKLYFPPSSDARQLRIIYTKSGATLALTDTIGIDDSEDVIACLAGGWAGMALGDWDIGVELISQALGPTHAKDGRIGGSLYELLQQGVKAMQGGDWRSLPFGVPIHNAYDSFEQ